MRKFLTTFAAGFVTGICFCQVMGRVSYLVISLKNVLKAVLCHWVYINPIVSGVH